MLRENQWQLFDLQKSQGYNLLDQAPDITLLINLRKLQKENLPNQVISMVPDPRPK